MNQLKIITFFSFILLVVCSCSAKKKLASSEVESLKGKMQGKDWEIKAMVIDKEKIEGGTISNALPYIKFSDHKINLVAYCNAYEGTYFLDKNQSFKVSIQDRIWIECQEDVALYEKILLKILRNANKIVLEENGLYLFQTEQTFLFLEEKK